LGRLRIGGTGGGAVELVDDDFGGVLGGDGAEQVGGVGAGLADVALDVGEIGGDGNDGDVGGARMPGPVEEMLVGFGVGGGLGIGVGGLAATSEGAEVIAVLPGHEAGDGDEVEDSHEDAQQAIATLGSGRRRWSGARQGGYSQG
jgi:hypothetical protein